MTIIFEGVVEYASEDGGQALIASIYEQTEPPSAPEEPGMFVRLQSWDEGGGHELARSLEGKRVRVTVEVIDQAGAAAGGAA
jgi:hypothetical protein